jgi:hypothetical protein
MEVEGAGEIQEKGLVPQDEVGRIGVVCGQRDLRSKAMSPLLACNPLYTVLYFVFILFHKQFLQLDFVGTNTFLGSCC